MFHKIKVGRHSLNKECTYVLKLVFYQIKNKKYQLPSNIKINNYNILDYLRKLQILSKKVKTVIYLYFQTIKIIIIHHFEDCHP